MKTKILCAVAVAAICLVPSIAQQRRPDPPPSPRLYVFDCGVIKGLPVTSFGFKEGEVPARDMVVPCYMITHPRGVLMWDVGLIPDRDLDANGKYSKRNSTVTKSLKSQMAAVGYSAADVTYLALSHYHSDHTANANDFAGATWLARQEEIDPMFSEKPPGIVEQAHFNKLKDAKKIILKTDEHDVFGDGSVIIKSAPGHTPGHQVLLVKLKQTGPILVAGDLYHLPEEGTMNRFPTFEFNKEQSAAARKDIDMYLKKTGAQIWIEHDAATYAKLKKSPAFYE
jgi:N-acyl homoserine lactone hydrolase